MEDAVTEWLADLNLAVEKVRAWRDARSGLTASGPFCRVTPKRKKKKTICKRPGNPHPRLQALWVQQRYECFYCRRIMRLFKTVGGGEQPADKCTLEHRIALVNGGRNNPENLVAACYRCNTAKGNRLEAEFVKNSPYVQPDSLALRGQPSTSSVIETETSYNACVISSASPTLSAPCAPALTLDRAPFQG